jgi:hypothetical protein
MPNYATRVAVVATVAMSAILAGGCSGSDSSDEPAATPPVSGQTSTEASASCAITDPQLLLLTRSWRLVLASYGNSDHPKYASAFSEEIDETIDDGHGCPAPIALTQLGVDASLIQANALSGSPGQDDLASAARAGNRWLIAMGYAEEGFQTPATRQDHPTFAGNIFTVALLDTKSIAAKVRFCATAPYQGGSIPVTRSPWSLQDQHGTLWPADSGGGLRGNAYPVEATVSVGDCLQGWIRFEAPLSTRPAWVIYNSDIGGPFTWDLTPTGSNVPPTLPSESPAHPDPQRDCYTLESAASPFPGTWLTLETRGQFTAQALKVQDRLNWLGYGCIPEDGDYGPVTREAVIRFQRDFGLVVDGNVGPQTWETLFTYY